MPIRERSEGTPRNRRERYYSIGRKNLKLEKGPTSLLLRKKKAEEERGTDPDGEILKREEDRVHRLPKGIQLWGKKKKKTSGRPKAQGKKADHIAAQRSGKPILEELRIAADAERGSQRGLRPDHKEKDRNKKGNQAIVFVKGNAMEDKVGHYHKRKQPRFLRFTKGIPSSFCAKERVCRKKNVLTKLEWKKSKDEFRIWKNRAFRKRMDSKRDTMS